QSSAHHSGPYFQSSKSRWGNAQALEVFIMSVWKELDGNRVTEGLDRICGQSARREDAAPGVRCSLGGESASSAFIAVCVRTGRTSRARTPPSACAALDAGRRRGHAGNGHG